MVELPPPPAQPPNAAAVADQVERLAASLRALEAHVLALPTPPPPGAEAGRSPVARDGHGGVPADLPRLLALVDDANKRYLDQWMACRRDLSLAVARQLIGQWDLGHAWIRRWGAWRPAAQRTLQAMLDETPTARTARGRGYAALLPLVLHLRYAGRQPCTTIARLLGVAAATVQGYVTAFEEEVARTVALETLRGRLPSPWRLLESGTPPRALALARTADQGDPALVGVEVTVAGGIRIRHENPLRPVATVRARGYDDPPVLWTVALYERLQVGFFPEPSSWRGMHEVPVDRLLSYAHRAAFDTPGEAIEDLCRGEVHARRAGHFFRT